MYFCPTLSQASSRAVRYWERDPSVKPVEPDDDRQVVSLAGDIRRLSHTVAKMILRFEDDADTRSRLNHDCGVFALACQNGEDQSGILFHQSGGLGIRPSHTTALPPLNELQPGQVILSTRANSLDELRRHHYAVVASADDRETLFASKMGVGPVTLATLGQLKNAYPYKTLGLVGSLETYPLN